MEVSPSCTYYNDCALYLLKVVKEAMFQAHYTSDIHQDKPHTHIALPRSMWSHQRLNLPSSRMHRTSSMNPEAPQQDVELLCLVAGGICRSWA